LRRDFSWLDSIGYGFSPGRAALRYPLARRYRLAIYDTDLDAAITRILFAPGGNGLEGLGRILARQIGAAERLKRAVHGAILVSVFALALLLFAVVSPPLRRV
jgi:hypothetical protein